MSEISRQYDTGNQPEGSDSTIEIRLSPEQTAVTDRALRLFAFRAMIDTDASLSEEDAAIVVGLLSRAHPHQLTLVQSPEKLKRLAEILRTASIPTENTEELTAVHVAAEIQATVEIHQLGDSFSELSADDFNQ